MEDLKNCFSIGLSAQKTTLTLPLDKAVKFDWENLVSPVARFINLSNPRGESYRQMLFFFLGSGLFTFPDFSAFPNGLMEGWQCRSMQRGLSSWPFSCFFIFL